MTRKQLAEKIAEIEYPRTVQHTFRAARIKELMRVYPETGFLFNILADKHLNALQRILSADRAAEAMMAKF